MRERAMLATDFLRGSFCVLACVAVLLGVACTSADAAETPIFNGDMEMRAPQGPPPGWSMWGADQFKDPANYVRDTQVRHSGEASLRIRHPANTSGYIVTSPERAVQPVRGKRYTFRFWARADKPGTSVFRLTAYEKIQPFVDAPSPGAFNFTVGPEWQQFSYSVDEGWDFSADRSRYVLLTFSATGDMATERTLWIDDVTVEETPTPREGRLEDISTIRYTPIDHRLRPGDRLEMTIDAGRKLRPATRRAAGVSFHRVVGWTGQPYNRAGDYTLAPEMERAISEMRLPMTRFYGVGDEPFGLEGGIDRVAETVKRVGISAQDTVIELETQGASTRIAPADWARAVRYVRDKGYGFRYWEVTNEPFVPTHSTFTPDSYTEHFLGVSQAIRAADPSAQIGVAIEPRSLTWGNQILKRAAGKYDFVVGHYYSHYSAYNRAFESVVLGDNYRILDRVARINGLIKAYNPGRDVYQLDTEWGMHSRGTNGEGADYVDRNANVYGALHRAVRLIYYTREDLLHGASSWQMFSGVNGQGFGILSQQAPEKRFLLYWLYYYWNRHVGDDVVALDGTAPYASLPASDFPGESMTYIAGPLTPAVATVSRTGDRLYLIVANGSWEREIPLKASLKGFRAQRATGVLLAPSGADAKPLLERTEDAVRPATVSLKGDALEAALPPHSVLFITLDRGAGR